MTMQLIKKSTSVAECPLYGISPLLLRNTFRVPSEFSTKWKAQLRRSPSDAAAVARFVHHDLGAFDAAWEGWLCKDGLLFPPDSVAVDPGQVRAIPLMRDQLHEYERAQRWMIGSSLAEHDRLGFRGAEVVGLLERAIEALRQR